MTPEVEELRDACEFSLQELAVWIGQLSEEIATLEMRPIGTPVDPNDITVRRKLVLSMREDRQALQQVVRLCDAGRVDETSDLVRKVGRRMWERVATARTLKGSECND